MLNFGPLLKIIYTITSDVGSTRVVRLSFRFPGVQGRSFGTLNDDVGSRSATPLAFVAIALSELSTRVITTDDLMPAK